MAPDDAGAATPEAEADAGWLGQAQDYAAAAAALAAEGVIAALVYAFALRSGIVLVLHFGVVLLLAAWLRRRRATAADLTVPLLLFIVTLLAGPVGALGALAAMPLLKRSPRDNALLAAWYRRISMSTEIDPAGQLANTVAAGRSIDVGAPVPPSFEVVMARGSLHERQTALGLIARKFHPDYAPALKAALKSPEPVVRVQAAAVAAKLRGELKRRLAELVARVPVAAADAGAARGVSREISALHRTGLLDSGDAAKAVAAVAELAKVRPAHAARGVLFANPRADDGAVEAELIAAGRFADLRRLRRARRLTRGGLFRLRIAARADGGART